MEEEPINQSSLDKDLRIHETWRVNYETIVQHDLDLATQVASQALDVNLLLFRNSVVLNGGGLLAIPVYWSAFFAGLQTPMWLLGASAVWFIVGLGSGGFSAFAASRYFSNTARRFGNRAVAASNRLILEYQDFHPDDFQKIVADEKRSRDKSAVDLQRAQRAEKYWRRLMVLSYVAFCIGCALLLAPIAFS